MARNRQLTALTSTLTPGGWSRVKEEKPKGKKGQPPTPKGLHVTMALEKLPKWHEAVRARNPRCSQSPCSHFTPRGKRRAAWHPETPSIAACHWRIMHEHDMTQPWAWLVFKTRFALPGHGGRHLVTTNIAGSLPATPPRGKTWVVVPIFTQQVTVHLFTERPFCLGGLVVNEMTRKLFRACSPVYAPDISVRANASSDAIPSCVSTRCTKVYAFAFPFTLLFSILSTLLTLPPPFF